MKRTTLSILLGLLVLGLTSPGFAKDEALPKMITFSSRPMGVHYLMSAGIAKVFEKETGIKVIVEGEASQYAYMPRFKKKETELALLASQYVYSAYHGLGRFKEQGKAPLAYLASTQLMPFIFWTIPESGIRTTKDMAGKTVATRNPTSPLGEEFSKKSLETAGVWDKVKHITRPAAGAQACQMLIEKKLDVLPMPPLPSLLQVESAVGLVPVGPGEEAIDELTRDPVWARYTLPQGKFSVKSPIDTAAFVSCMFTRKDLPDDLAYLLVKTSFENLDQLIPFHRNFKQWSLKRAVQNIPIPMHTGAIKYYKEKGVWTEKEEAVQRKLLAEGQ